MNEEDLELTNFLNQMDNSNNLLNLQLLSLLKRDFDYRHEYRLRRRIDYMNDFNRRDFKKRFRFYKDEVEYIYHLIDGENTLQPMVSE